MEAAASVVLRGVTLATDPAPQQAAGPPSSSGGAGGGAGPPSVDWLARLVNFFAFGGASQPAAEAAAAAASPTAEQHSPSTAWTVSLQVSASVVVPNPADLCAALPTFDEVALLLHASLHRSPAGGCQTWEAAL